MKSNKCLPSSTALPLVFSLGACLSHHQTHPRPFLVDLGCGEERVGCSPAAPLSLLSLCLVSGTWARGQAFMPGGLRGPQIPPEAGARGQGKAELDSTLAFHQLAGKVSGNLFRKSNLGLSPKQACPAPLSPSQIPIQPCHPVGKPPSKKNQLNFKGFLLPSVFSTFIKGFFK